VAADVTGSAGDENGFVWHNWSVNEIERMNEWMREYVEIEDEWKREKSKGGVL
jgi:hypothetical protein